MCRHPSTTRSSIAIALGDGRGGLVPRAPVPVRSRPFYVRLADLDADGDLDAVATHDDRRRVDVLLGDGRGGLEPARGLADLDGDGRLDVVLPDPADEGARVLLGADLWP